MNPINRALRRGRPGLVLVVSAAVLLALSSAVTAATLITGRQIESGSVTGRDLRNATVTGADAREGSLAARDYSGAVVGAPGPEGPAGADGPAGEQGVAGVRGLWRVLAAKDDVAPGAWGWADVRCPTGTRVLSGGVGFLNAAAEPLITETAPLNDGIGWTGAFRNEGTSNLTGYIWAVCASAS